MASSTCEASSQRLFSFSSFSSSGHMVSRSESLVLFFPFETFINVRHVKLRPHSLQNAQCLEKQRKTRPTSLRLHFHPDNYCMIKFI